MTDYEADETNPPNDRRTYRNYLLRAKGVQDWSDIEAANGIHVSLTQGAPASQHRHAAVRCCLWPTLLRRVSPGA